MSTVYIIIGQSGHDRYKEIEWADTDEEVAYTKVESVRYDTVYFEIWNGMLLSSYTRDYISPDGLGRGDHFSKWERLSGQVNNRLEGK
jgi:hypothetical protein